MVAVYAENIKTGELLELAEFDTMIEAEFNIAHNLEYDEEDNPEEWKIFTVEEFNVDGFDECGFDPYLGCYTDDC